jgi:hypothetical protein
MHAEAVVKVTPPETFVRQDDTHRLIPSKYVDGDKRVFSRISDNRDQLDSIFELDSATNPRLIAESAGLPGISKELVFGVPYAHIINGCFANPAPTGHRFNGPERGAWYAAFELETAKAEIAYHRLEWIQETAWKKESVCTYVDFLADFRNSFHDLRGDNKFDGCLHPTDYTQSQAFATLLLAQKSMGVIYPSVRHPGGTCIACFRPVLVTNVRRDITVGVRYDPAARDITFS